ncbi:hypothetical protein BDZ89DRAFT_940130 [Hymenopellis radicata]|nr:hypothetical protein BDZ89DRAFT_940130 [Hymenopellis radicata]
MAGLQVTVTPPHPPPSHDEEAPSTSFEVVMKQRLGPSLVKAICWLAALAECLVIVAHSVPDIAFSHFVLSKLVTTGGAQHISISPLFLLGTLLTVIGGYIRYRCYRELGSLFTFEMSIRADHRLITTGPYSVVRHPGYLGVVCAVLGIVCWHGSSGSWARTCGAFDTKLFQVLSLVFLILVTIITMGLMRRMSKEDEALRREFHQDWDDWAELVPCKLIPGVY